MKVVYLLLLVGLALSYPSSDRVTNVPWAPFQPSFSVFSGYLNITTQKALHYVLVSSQNNNDTDPLVLWLNGGPGCSSMDGLFYENGPFIFQYQSTNMTYNNYTWNTNASMLYLESPVGVGFSTYGNNASNLNTNDSISAADNLAALVLFFQEFPELQGLPFYIAGESYAGIYIPYLAQSIVTYSGAEIKFNFQGFLIGNGVTDWNVDAGNAFPYFAYTHDLTGINTYNLWVENNCNANNIKGMNCQEANDEINVLMEDMNYYDIYRDCDFDPTRISSKSKYTPWRKHFGLKEEVPCVDDLGLHFYLNNATVRKAWHIGSSFTNTWEICNGNLNYTINYVLGSFYLYQTLLKQGLKILIYSGDTDAAVPVTGTREWIQNLGLAVVNPWRQWGNGYFGQVAGYTTDYANNFTFTTIKGTGHMSIEWKRPQGYYMFYSFIQGTPLN